MCIELEPKKSAPVTTARPTREKPKPTYLTNDEVERLVARFDAAELPKEQWTHAAHLIVALAYARRHRPDEAFSQLRLSIKRLNKAHGSTGYHETITRAWFGLVLHFLDLFDDGRSLAGLAEALTELFSKVELFLHYSRERLLSPEARAAWVEPDDRPLPALVPFTREDQRWLQALDARAAALPVTAPAPALAGVA
jgi:hypothetical protein